MIESFTDNLRVWFAQQPDIRAIAIVGSHARGTARIDSDIDVIMICANPEAYRHNASWLADFGTVKSFEREDWGLMQSFRVFYEEVGEVEFGITSEEWCTDWAVQNGTGRVIADGVMPIADPFGVLSALIGKVAGSNFPSGHATPDGQ